MDGGQFDLLEYLNSIELPMCRHRTIPFEENESMTELIIRAKHPKRQMRTCWKYFISMENWLVKVRGYNKHRMVL